MKRESGFEAGRQERRRRHLWRSPLTPTARHVCRSQDLDLGLVWRTGQAWIRVRNPGERSAISHRRRCAELERAEENRARGDLGGSWSAAPRLLAVQDVRAGVRIRGHPLVCYERPSCFLDTVLSSMSHHQVLCLVLHACLFARVV